MLVNFINDKNQTYTFSIYRVIQCSLKYSLFYSNENVIFQIMDEIHQRISVNTNSSIYYSIPRSFFGWLEYFN